MVYPDGVERAERLFRRFFVPDSGGGADGSDRQVWFLNRGLFVLRPREPFVDWVLRADPHGGNVDPAHVSESHTGYLVPSFDYTEAELGAAATGANPPPWAHSRRSLTTSPFRARTRK